MRFYPLSWVSLVLLAGVLAPVAAPAMPAADAKHLVGRTGFGAGPDDIAALDKLTHEQAVRRLLDTARREPFTKLPDFLATRPDWPGQYRSKDDLAKQEFNRTRDREGAALKAWWYGEMIATPSPFTERMVLFWHNHFTSSFDKVRQPDLMYKQQAIFRRHAFGMIKKAFDANGIKFAVPQVQVAGGGDDDAIAGAARHAMEVSRAATKAGATPT